MYRAAQSIPIRQPSFPKPLVAQADRVYSLRRALVMAESAGVPWPQRWLIERELRRAERKALTTLLAYTYPAGEPLSSLPIITDRPIAGQLREPGPPTRWQRFRHWWRLHPNAGAWLMVVFAGGTLAALVLVPR